MKINPIPYLANNTQVRKYMHWSTKKTLLDGASPCDKITNFQKVQKIYPKIFMVWLAGIQCYFLNKSDEMPKERKIPLMFNNLYSCIIALGMGVMFGKHIDKITKTMVKRAESVYKSESIGNKNAMINGIRTGIPFLTETLLFQYIGPVIATPIACETTNYLAKKGVIDLKANNKK